MYQHTILGRETKELNSRLKLVNERLLFWYLSGVMRFSGNKFCTEYSKIMENIISDI
jgi:hypothetical protein